jgi:hypothetical protein
MTHPISALKTTLIKHLTFLALTAVWSPLQAAEPEAGKRATVADRMDQTRALLKKWAETERMMAAERREWEQGKSLLEARIALVEQSIEETNRKIREATEQLEQARKESAQVENEIMQARSSTDALRGVAADLESGLRALLERVPPSVQQKVKVLADRMPKAGSDAKAITAAERYQNVLGIINELNKSNLEIASQPEIHDVGQGRKAEVKVIYVGLGQGYFVNEAGDIGGHGVPGPKGWQWLTDPGLAPKAIEVIEVMKKSVSPKLVELPASID